MRCEHCRGTGQTAVFACPGFHSRITPCTTCQGAGEFSDVRRQELADAEALRQYRLSLNVSCHQFAQARGLDYVAYNHQEHGRQPISAELLQELLGRENR